VNIIPGSQIQFGFLRYFRVMMEKKRGGKVVMSPGLMDVVSFFSCEPHHRAMYDQESSKYVLRHQLAILGSTLEPR
jgi:hypothetical protein